MLKFFEVLKAKLFIQLHEAVKDTDGGLSDLQLEVYQYSDDCEIVGTRMSEFQHQINIIFRYTFNVSATLETQEQVLYGCLLKCD
jgi:hypothetical protein